MGGAHFRKGDAGALRQLRQRLAEIEVLDALDEVDGVPARCACSKATPGLALGEDVKGGGALVVEGAASLEVAAALLQRDALRHQVHDVQTALDVVDEGHWASYTRVRRESP